MIDSSALSPSSARRRPRAAIFDLDGTLADTLDDIASALNAGLAALGRAPASREQVRAWVGDGLPVLCRRAWPDADESRLAELIRAAQRHYREHYLDHTRLYPGVDPLLRTLAAARIPLAVLSNKPHELTVLTVRGLGIESFFADVRGYVTEADKKPAPTVPWAIAAAWKLPPTDVLFVGDGQADLFVARAAGMIGVSVTWGFRTRAELTDLGADRLADHPREIAAFFGLTAVE